MEEFATDLAAQDRETFGEGRHLLHRIKGLLGDYCVNILTEQVNVVVGHEVIRGATARYQGVHQWTINFDVPTAAGNGSEAPLQIKFGPSAWFVIEQDEGWHETPDPAVADYGHLFVCRASTSEVRQSAVALREVLAGLQPDDTRLRDELLTCVRD